MDTTNIILRCGNIHRHFTPGETGGTTLHVLRGIDLEIAEGEFVVIVGASGSGKSTLLHILGGLDVPTSGNVYWRGEDISGIREEQIARLRGKEIGFVFQFHHLLGEFTALENVVIPLMIAGVQQREAAARAQRLLGSVGLGERLHHKPSELSGGEQQRVAVARALANNPSIILADEPSGNLDSVNSERLHELLKELNRSERRTFLIVTHNEKFAANAHRVFRMQDGLLHLQ